MTSDESRKMSHELNKNYFKSLFGVLVIVVTREILLNHVNTRNTVDQGRKNTLFGVKIAPRFHITQIYDNKKTQLSVSHFT